MPTNHYEVIIVGLGAAGVAAAATLAAAGRKVLALEAQDYVGGRVKSVPFGDGIVELGAEWVHGEKNNTVYEQAFKSNITLLPQGVDLTTYRSDGSKPDEEVQKLISTLVEQQQCDEMELPEEPGGFGDFVMTHIKQYIKDNHPDLLKDEDFIVNLMDFMNLLVNNHNASNDWNDVNANDKYMALDGHLYMSWHQYGYKTFFDILLNNHNNSSKWPNLVIRLKTEVMTIYWPQEPRENVIVSCRDGATYTADSVIITVSLGVLKERHETLFNPKLPESKIEPIKKIAMGVMDKIELSFEDIWWPLHTAFFGFLWKGEDRRRVSERDYWTTKIFAASRPMGATNVLTLWTSGEIGRLVETLPEEEVKGKCRGLLQKFMGANMTVPEPSGILRSKWHSNPYTKGSYTYDSINCADHPTARQDLAAPLADASGRPRLLFAGEATHEIYFSTVHGAADTGYREALRLLKYGSKI